MNTKNIFKTVALAMMMPAMLLTTACSNEDDAINNGDNKKGYPLQVTVNVSREGDAGTRATYTDNGNGTGSLAFSAGDKLFVSGDYNLGKKFAGTLDYVPATGKFSGTIYTQNEWDNSADALFTSAQSIYATLLPAGYDSYNFLSIDNNGTTEVAYDDRVSISRANAFAASATAKATGVEQFSYERASSYSGSFALAHRYAVLNFTITGLAAGAQDVTLQVTDGNPYSVTGSVTPNALGVATFAVGVPDYTKMQAVANNLTVGSSNFTLPSNIDYFYKGKIYNITRSTLTYPIALSAVTSSYVCSIVTTDGNVYATVADATAASKTAAAMIAYVSGTGHGLALALADEGWMNWSTAKTTCEAHTPAVTGGTWQLPSQEEWNNMITATGSYTALRDGFSSFGGTNMNSSTYWSSTDAYTIGSLQIKYGYNFNEGSWGTFGSTGDKYTRACLAF